MSYFNTISEVIDTSGDVESIEVSLVVKNATGSVNITDVMLQSGLMANIWQGHPSEHKWSEDN